MGNLTSNFDRSEFACQCGCGFDTVDYMLLLVLEDLRAHFDKEIYITSGCRCRRYNRVVGGRMFSQHPRGRAADVMVSNTSSNIVQNYLCDKYPKRFGIGCYDSFTHIDVRNRKARWK